MQAYSAGPPDPQPVKSALLYVILVGLPVLGVLGVLRVGERIVPPAAVSGQWQVERGGGTCVVPGGTFSVAQSGEFLHLSIPGRADLPARLRDGVLSASGGARDGISPGCGQSPVRIRARVGSGERMEGSAGVPGCAGCPLQPFAAVRVVSPVAP